MEGTVQTISIIMPLYNAERYLAETLQSVLAQTYENFELICIDDCSNDATAEILADFQKEDVRIRILVNECRLGAAESRNRGLKEAQGKYVTFMDGDDIFDEELLEKTYYCAEEHDVDIVIFEYMHVPCEEIYIKRIAGRSDSFLEKYSKYPFSVKTYTPENFPNWSDSVCDKLFRRKFICDHDIVFQNLPSFNDVYFAKMATYCAEKIIWLSDTRIMLYARNHFTLSRISNNRDPMCAYYAMEKLGTELKARNMMADLAAHFYYRMLIMMLSVLKNEKDGKRQRDFYNFLHYKGILNLIDYGKENYDQIDIYAQYLLESFSKHSYESGWFNSPDTYFQVYLRKNGETICQFIVDKLIKGKTVIIWGIGINGTSLLRYLSVHNIKVSAVVDIDEKKQGNFVEGYEIGSPHALPDNVNYIITTSDSAYQDVEIRFKGTSVTVLNAFELIVQFKSG